MYRMKPRSSFGVTYSALLSRAISCAGSSPYNTHFKGKMRIDGALCFYIHDYYPTRCKDISVFDRKTSNLVFRFKEGRQAALVAKIFSLCIARMPFFKEKAANAVLIPIPAATRERNITRFARFCSLLSHRLKVVDGIRCHTGMESPRIRVGQTGQRGEDERPARQLHHRVGQRGFHHPLQFTAADMP